MEAPYSTNNEIIKTYDAVHGSVTLDISTEQPVIPFILISRLRRDRSLGLLLTTCNKVSGDPSLSVGVGVIFIDN